MKLLSEMHYEYIIGALICMLSSLLVVEWVLQCRSIISGHSKADIHSRLI